MAPNNENLSDVILQRIHSLLSQAVLLSSKAQGTLILDALLVIKSNADEVSTLIRQQSHLFFKPRVILTHYSVAKQVPIKKEPLSNNELHVWVKDEELAPVKIESEPTDVPTLETVGDQTNHLQLESHVDDEHCSASPSPHNSDDAEINSIDYVNSFQKPTKKHPKNCCCVCGKSLFKSKSVKNEEDREKLMLIHVRRYHPEKILKCVCGVNVCGEASMGRHMESHPDAQFGKHIDKESCPHCGMKFLTESGRLSKTVKFFWVQKGDVNFVSQHLVACQRRSKYSTQMDRCPHCRKQIRRKFALQHLLETHKDKARRCDICGEWWDMAHLGNHRRHTHVYGTRKKEEEAKKKEEEERRKRIEHEHFCELCNDQVTSTGTNDDDEAQKIHMKSCHSKDILKCDCGDYIWSETQKKRHVSEHVTMSLKNMIEVVQTSACSTCGLKFFEDDGSITSMFQYFLFDQNDPNFAQNHVRDCERTINFRRPHKCRVCRVEYRKYLQSRHYIDFHRNLLRRCEFCELWIPKRLLFEHRRKKHGVGFSKKLPPRPRPRQYESVVCPDCGKVFYDKNKLANHEKKCRKVDLLEREIECQFCKEMVKSSEISHHELRHIRDGKLYDCSYCGKKLPHKTWVRHEAKHKKILEKGKPPAKECHLCHRRVVHMADHLKRHDGSNLKTCDGCGQKYANLQRHKLFHCGIVTTRNRRKTLYP